MNRTPILMSALVIVSAAALVLTGCGTSSRPDTPTTAPAQQWEPTEDLDTSTSPPSSATEAAPAPTPETTLASPVDRSDAVAVATAAVTLWFTWDTRTDTNTLNAVARTAPLLTSTFRTAALSSGSASAGNTWLVWANRQAVVTPKVEPVPNQGAPDAPARRFFIFTVTQTGRTSSGEQVGASVTRNVWVIAVNTGGSWEVSQISEQN